MSEQLKKVLSHMSTEQLEEILRLDLQSNDDELDADTFLEITKVLDERTRQEDKCDPSEMWDKFCSDYLPVAEARRAEENGGSATSQEKSKEQKSDSCSKPEHKVSKKHKFGRLARVACVALVIGVLVTGTVSTVASAAGYDIWGAVGRWTAEFFQFDTGRSDSLLEAKPIVSDLNREIYDVLKEYGIEDVFLPSWYPEGYSLQDVEASDDTEYPVIKAKYVQADSGNKILLRIGIGDQNTQTYYEKDSSEVVIYNYNGIDYYILSDKDKMSVVWYDGIFECAVGGQFSVEDAKLMVDSIHVK